MRVTSLAYAFLEWKSFDEYAEYIKGLVQKQSCDLLILPEYAGLELLSLSGTIEYEAAASYFDAYLALYSECAKTNGIHIVAGSIPHLKNGKLYNISPFLYPDGTHRLQYKTILTPFEHERNVQKGEDLGVIDTDFGKIAVAICYMVEFPLIIRRYAEKGAKLILCPSYTDDWYGYNRVAIGARARALENQCYVAVSALNGDFPWIDESARGKALIAAPPDIGMPENGILEEHEQAASVMLDFDLLHRIKKEGAVRTFTDWELSK